MSGRRKQELREAMIVARLRLSPEDRAAFTHAIAARVTALEVFLRARTLALYAPVGAEVGTAEIARAAEALGKRVAYPRLVDGARALAFALCEEDALQPGALGTREPPPDSPAVLPFELDTVVVPGLAFDGCGRRLGRGRGYYDATLATLPAGTTRVGLAFETQIVPEVPHEAHDLALDVVVTETAVRFRPPGTGSSGDTSH
jgi:5-formyltetrahydrofolate cyclo-ligase